MHHDQALSDAIALIVFGTANGTLAMALLSWRNPDRRLSWRLRDLDLQDARTARTLTGLGLAAVIWGGIGLQQWVVVPLAVVIAFVPLLVIRIVVWWRHNRRVARRTPPHLDADPQQRETIVPRA